MSISVKHAFVSHKADSTDATVVKPSDWNADHDLAVTGTPGALQKNTGSAIADSEILVAENPDGLSRRLQVGPPYSNDYFGPDYFDPLLGGGPANPLAAFTADSGLRADVDIMVADEGGGNLALNMLSSRGTVDAPAASVDLDFISILGFNGHDGVNSRLAGDILSYVDGPVSPGEVRGGIRLENFAAAGGTSSLDLRSNGNIEIDCPQQGADLAVRRSAAGILEINNGTPGQLAELRASSVQVGGAAGWELTHTTSRPQYPLLRPLGTFGTPSGALHLYMIPGGPGANVQWTVVGDPDPTITNVGLFELGLKNGIAFAQSAVFGSGTPVTQHLFGEVSGQSSLVTWSVQFGGVDKLTVTRTGITAPTIITTPSTVAALPSSPVAGQRAFVTDSNAVSMAAAFGLPVAGGGTTRVPVVYDGSAWRVG